MLQRLAAMSLASVVTDANLENAMAESYDVFSIIYAITIMAFSSDSAILDRGIWWW